MKSKVLIGTVAVAAALGLSACSVPGGANSGAQTGNASTQDASAQTNSKALLDGIQADSKLQALVPAEFKGKTLAVGSNLQTPPNSFLAEDSKTAIGYDIDLITAAAKKLDLKVDVKNMVFNTLITSLETKRVDLTISAMNDNKVRQQKIDFVDYFNSGMKFLVKKDNPANIKSAEDLCGKTVGTNVGVAAADWVQKTASPACIASGKPEIKLNTNEVQAQMFNDLKTGRNDAVIDDLPYLSYVAATSGSGNDFQVADNELIDPVPYGIGFNKQNPGLRDAFQAALQQLMDDGTYGQILDNWKVKAGALTAASVNGGS
ncbi:ABC transporter substrate-binding protein [Paenarthrobacter sp. NPDC089675]|uniref:ABC transporter substrate-binding protein n=1 Tax=Paenarthrobacter TaxID=1742992 RepID=UPI00380F0C67